MIKGWLTLGPAFFCVFGGALGEKHLISQGFSYFTRLIGAPGSKRGRKHASTTKVEQQGKDRNRDFTA